MTPAPKPTDRAERILAGEIASGADVPRLALALVEAECLLAEIKRDAWRGDLPAIRERLANVLEDYDYGVSRLLRQARADDADQRQAALDLPPAAAAPATRAGNQTSGGAK